VIDAHRAYVDSTGLVQRAQIILQRL